MVDDRAVIKEFVRDKCALAEELCPIHLQLRHHRLARSVERPSLHRHQRQLYVGSIIDLRRQEALEELGAVEGDHPLVAHLLQRPTTGSVEDEEVKVGVIDEIGLKWRGPQLLRILGQEAEVGVDPVVIAVHRALAMILDRSCRLLHRLWGNRLPGLRRDDRLRSDRAPLGHRNHIARTGRQLKSRLIPHIDHSLPTDTGHLAASSRIEEAHVVTHLYRCTHT